MYNYFEIEWMQKNNILSKLHKNVQYYPLWGWGEVICFHQILQYVLVFIDVVFKVLGGIIEVVGIVSILSIFYKVFVDSRQISLEASWMLRMLNYLVQSVWPVVRGKVCAEG